MPSIPCLNTSTIRPAPLSEKIRLAGEAGFRAIEPWNDDVDAYLKAGGSMESLRRESIESAKTRRKRKREERQEWSHR